MISILFLIGATRTVKWYELSLGGGGGGEAHI